MKTITYDQLKQMLKNKDDFVLINVLSTSDYKRAHIPDSINVPFDQSDFESQVEEAADGKDRKIVVHCGSFECPLSRRAAEKLENAGFTDVYAYEGGIKEWLEKEGDQTAAA